MKFTDSATLSGTRRTGDGYLIADAFAVRTGIQIYAGSEMGRPDLAIVRVYRPEAEVRAADSLRTFSHAPVTMGHPAEAVTSDNWAKLAKGEVSTEATWQDGKIKLPLILKDADTIAAVEAGTRELSAGYTCQVEFTDGVTEDGQAYDAIQRNIVANHVAIVPRGRAGTEFRIGDSADHWGLVPVSDAGKEVPMSLRKFTLDGLTIETTDAGVQAIEKLQGQIAAKDADHATALATKDAAIAKVEGERDAAIAAKDAAEAKVLDAAALDKMVADRGDLVAKAATIAPEVKTAGLDDADIRKAVVVAKLGDAMKDKPAAYLDARFDILAEDASADPVREIIKDGIKVVANDAWSAAAASSGVKFKEA